MSPIEKIAIAIAEYAESQLPETNEFRIVLRSQRLAVARVALLALAECDFEDGMLNRSMERYYQGPENDEAAAFGGGVKELIRSIAKGGEE